MRSVRSDAVVGSGCGPACANAVKYEIQRGSHLEAVEAVAQFSGTVVKPEKPEVGIA